MTEFIGVKADDNRICVVEICDGSVALFLSNGSGDPGEWTYLGESTLNASSVKDMFLKSGHFTIEARASAIAEGILRYVSGDQGVVTGDQNSASGELFRHPKVMSKRGASGADLDENTKK